MERIPYQRNFNLLTTNPKKYQCNEIKTIDQKLLTILPLNERNFEDASTKMYHKKYTSYL